MSRRYRIRSSLAASSGMDTETSMESADGGIAITVSSTRPAPGRTTVMRARSKSTTPATLLSNTGTTARWPEMSRGAVESRRQLKTAIVASRNQTTRRVMDPRCRSPAPLDERAKARTEQRNAVDVLERAEGNLCLQHGGRPVAHVIAEVRPGSYQVPQQLHLVGRARQFVAEFEHRDERDLGRHRPLEPGARRQHVAARHRHGAGRGEAP